MNKLGKFSSTVSKKLQSRKPNKNNSSGGLTLQEVVKEATAKSLRCPDADLNQQVVDLIGSAIHTDGPKEVAKTLTDRLTLKNPHKVWLAVELIKEVLQRCESEVSPVRDDIMAEVGKVANSAMNRFDSNLEDQQRAKSAAFNLLKIYGHDGHILSQPHVAVVNKRMSADGNPRTPRTPQGRSHDRPNGRHYTWPEISEGVQTQMAVATSHSDLLQDMLLDTSSFESRSPEQRALAKDIILEATQFRQSFEQLLGQLSTFNSDEASRLMTAALEKMDVLNNSLNLHKDMLVKQLNGQKVRRDPQRGSQQSAPRSSQHLTAATGQQPPLGGILELQSGLEASTPPHQAQHANIVDPFAASSQWQQRPEPQGWQQQRPLFQEGTQYPQASGTPVYSGSWQGGPPPAIGHYPGFGPGGYTQVPQLSYSQAPNGQGYGGQQNWGAPGYGPPPQGYGHYGPYGQPYHHPQHYNQGIEYSPSQAPQSQGHQPGDHVPPPTTEAVINIPPQQTNSGASAGNSNSSHAAGSSSTGATKQVGNRGQESPPHLPKHASTSPAAPGTPPASHDGTSGAASPSHMHAARNAMQSNGSLMPATSTMAIQRHRQSDSASTHAPGIGVAKSPSGNPPEPSPAQDDWDLFFMERAGQGSEKVEGNTGGGLQRQAVEEVTDSFGELATSRATKR